MVTFDFKRGKHVSYLTAPYSLLVEAFGHDGTSGATGDLKVAAMWELFLDDSHTDYVEIYDYKINNLYDPDGLPLEEITNWNVQGTDAGIEYLLTLLTIWTDDNYDPFEV